jgi:nucleoside diphosphate kinase
MARKIEKLTPEQVAQLQHSHQGKDYYDELLNYMTRFIKFFFIYNLKKKYFILVVHRNY